MKQPNHRPSPLPAHKTNPIPQHRAGSPSSADPGALLAADLRSATDRARDERLKLAAMVKQQQTTVQMHGGPAAADQVAALSEKIQKLDQAVATRLQALAKAESRMDERLARLDDLQDSITQASKAFTRQVEQAQHFKHHIDAAKQHVRMSAGQIVEDIRLHLQEFEGPIAERLAALNDLDDQIDKRIARMQQMHKQAGEAVDKHLLGALRQAKEQAASMTDPIKRELDQFLRDQALVMEKAIQDKVASLDVDVEDALRPVTERFEQVVAQARGQAAELADALPGELDARCETHIEQLRETLVAQVTALMQSGDEQVVEEAAGRYREAVGDKLGAMCDEIEHEADAFAQKLGERFEQTRDQAEARFAGVLDNLEMDSAERAAKLADVMAERIDGLNERARAEVDATVAEVDQSVSESLQTVLAEIEKAAGEKVDAMLAGKRTDLEEMTGRFTKDIDTAFEQAIERIDALRTQAEQTREQITGAEGEADQLTARLHAITDCIDESAAQAREQLTEFEAATGDRLDGVENAAEARIEEIRDALAQHMRRIEQGAADRLDELTTTAEQAGHQVTDAIRAMTEDAKQQAGGYQAVSRQAREEAQAAIRHELAELHSASKAMVEVVNRRLRTQLDETQATVDQVVQQLEQRLDAVRHQLPHPDAA